jgi:hypothetical protein
MTFIAARYDFSRSVTMTFGVPYRFVSGVDTSFVQDVLNLAEG